MLWDAEYFYIAAEISDPHVWGTLTRHDEIVFHDNDFEVFIDPNGDAREYYELEVNALGTVFDLFLHRRYKEDGPAEHGWNAEGLKTFVHVNGTLNDPTDTDKGWTLEWAIPWSAFKPPNWDKPGFGEKERAAAAPKDGEVAAQLRGQDRAEAAGAADQRQLQAGTARARLRARAAEV
jgi:hypothetical protein